jgi:uncharacterized protein
MSIIERINSDIKKAMLAKDKIRLTALRAAKSAFLLASTETSDKNISPAKELQIIRKLIKQRHDSASIYKEQNRPELYEQESMEAEILSEYLPAQMDTAEVKDIIKSIIDETGASSIKDMGKVMGIATKKLSGRADNKTVSEIVREFLT